MNQHPKTVVVASDGHGASTAYGPFSSELEAKTWAVRCGDTYPHLTFTVLALVPGTSILANAHLQHQQSRYLSVRARTGEA
jgi:hypothetical protein